VAFNEFQLGKDVNRIYQRLALIEAQLKKLSEAVGVPYEDASDGVPPEVVELVKNGDRLGAIKLYRELTGASGDDARDLVNSL
jgi:ribosomal protein L7/L12